MLNRQRLFRALKRRVFAYYEGQRVFLDYVSDNCLRMTIAGEEERLVRIPRPALIDYDGYILRFYKAGYRQMTDGEKALYFNWQTFHADSIVDKIKFFKRFNKPYLVGLGEFNGLMLDRKRFNDNVAECILDISVRGELQYEFRIC